MLQHYLRLEGLALSWVGPGRFIFSLNYSDAAFEVQLASSGRVVLVPAGQTVLQALAAAGVEVLSSCEQGVCGTCVTRWLDGEPDHRDSCLSTAEHATHVAVCGARRPRAPPRGSRGWRRGGGPPPGRACRASSTVAAPA